MLQITSLCEKVTNSSVEEFEREIGTKLPEDYRKFLLDYNAAEIRPNIFWIEDEKEENGIRYFLGICEDEWYDLTANKNNYRERVPPNLLPFASDEDSSLVCISIEGDDYGRIYFWDRHQEGFDNKPDYRNVHLLADSFSNFLKKLENYMHPNNGKSQE